MEISVLVTVVVLCGCSYVTTKDHELVVTANKVEAEYINGILHTTALYKKISHEAEVLAQLKATLRRELKTKNSQLLASILCAGGSNDIKRKVNQHIDMFFDNYEEQLVEDILHDAIEAVQGCATYDQIMDLLLNIHERDDLRSFELMLKTQLDLYRATQSQHMGDRAFNGKFAFTLHKIKQTNLYQSINVNMKQQIDQLISQFPTNVQYLLFHPHFCLMSSKYSEYIYTAVNANNMDSTSRYIWVWYDKKTIDYMGPIKATVFESNAANTTDLLVQLKSYAFNVFFYMVPQTKLVAGWESTSEPANYIWNIEFIDDERVAFYLGDYIMCTTDQRYDSYRRELRAYKRGLYTSESAECQWLLGKCNRK